MITESTALPGNSLFSRRALLKAGALLIAPGGAVSAASLRPDERVFTAGLLTDVHFADKPTAGSRYYRESQRKMEEAAEQIGAAQPDFVVELGDLIDRADDVATELRYLKTINRVFSGMSAERHYVLGNHCVDTLKKSEFLDAVGQERSWYSFDRAGVRFIVLDACFRGDGVAYERRNFKWTDANISEDQLEWLQGDLATAEGSVIVFAHQRLDDPGPHGVRNQQAVRRLLEAAEKVSVVFQGHSHQNDLRVVNGISYCTLAAVVEGSGAEMNAYSLLSLDAAGNVELQGYRRQADFSGTR